MDTYKITTSTLMIEYYNENMSTIYELDSKFIIDNTLDDIMFNSCIFYGSTYDGRIEASKKILNTNIKLPIIVEEVKKIIFFPTKTIKDKSCMLISFNNLEKIEKDNQKTKLYFKNGKTFYINVSFDVIDRQFYNCLKLERMLMIRQEKA